MRRRYLQNGSVQAGIVVLVATLTFGIIAVSQGWLFGDDAQEDAVARAQPPEETTDEPSTTPDAGPSKVSEPEEGEDDEEPEPAEPTPVGLTKTELEEVVNGAVEGAVEAINGHTDSRVNQAESNLGLKVDQATDRAVSHASAEAADIRTKVGEVLTAVERCCCTPGHVCPECPEHGGQAKAPPIPPPAQDEDGDEDEEEEISPPPSPTPAKTRPRLRPRGRKLWAHPGGAYQWTTSRCRGESCPYRKMRQYGQKQAVGAPAKAASKVPSKAQEGRGGES